MNNAYNCGHNIIGHSIFHRMANLESVLDKFQNFVLGFSGVEKKTLGILD